MFEIEAKQVLAEVKAARGRNYKTAIRNAWMNGNYADEGLSQWCSQLQNIRNQYGPSWLVKAQPLNLMRLANALNTVIHYRNLYTNIGRCCFAHTMDGKLFVESLDTGARHVFATLQCWDCNRTPVTLESLEVSL